MCLFDTFQRIELYLLLKYLTEFYLMCTNRTARIYATCAMLNSSSILFDCVFIKYCIAAERRWSSRTANTDIKLWRIPVLYDHSFVYVASCSAPHGIAYNSEQYIKIASFGTHAHKKLECNVAALKSLWQHII